MPEEIMEYAVDPVESVRGTMTRRVVDAGIFEAGQIQKENAAAPEVVPYCRITVPQGAEFAFDSMQRQSKIIIVEFDILVSVLTGTRSAGQYAARIEGEFGLFSRSGIRRNIELPGWTGASANVCKYGRGTASAETDRNLFYLPVLIYVKLELETGAGYAI